MVQIFWFSLQRKCMEILTGGVLGDRLIVDLNLQDDQILKFIFLYIKNIKLQLK